ncbi:hypothetical protein PIB30_107860, partial [Stylosanthes scabra]|nr:hypothetical protein [Stylosanthes scabra]
IGEEVAKESARNEEITKKILKAKFRSLCVSTKADVRTHCHDLGGTSRLEPDPMHTHQRQNLKPINRGRPHHFGGALIHHFSS